MASNTLERPLSEMPDHRPGARGDGFQMARLLAPFASLRLTVVLLAMAIFLIFAGTLAQTEKDIWEVMRLYFRTPLAWIDLQIFFPKSFFPPGGQPIVPGGFWFPGGFAIGTAMVINLLAAHGLRFKIQARGTRLAAGLAVLAAGAMLTWLVITLGADKEGFEGSSGADWTLLWRCFQLALASLCAYLVYSAWTIDRSRKLERAMLGVLAGGLTALLLLILYLGADATPAGSSMRILWQLIKGGMAGLVLLAGCILVFRKRAGIVLLHAGLLLMMGNELVVYFLHNEGQMQIKEGETVNFVQDIRTFELAIVDRSDPKYDEMVVIPKSALLGEKLAHNDELPFDVEVVKYLPNASISRGAPQKDNPATAGAGLHYSVREERPSSGTDSGGKVDLPAAYVRFLKKGTSEPLGTYLLSLELVPQKIAVEGKPYEVTLRFKRTYKPYSVYLQDVRADTYYGSEKPKSYASFIRLVDDTRSVDREKKIWMNNPLRYAGETFYQSSYARTPDGEVTTLQVVTNTGWMIPYVGCMIVVIGLCAQFSTTLVRFLNRRHEEEAKTLARAPRGRAVVSSRAAFWVPIVIVALGGTWILADAMKVGRPGEGMDLYAFGKLPVHHEGRVKPFDTLARNSLCVISGKESFEETVKDKDGEDTKLKQPAIRWLLDLIVQPAKAFTYPIFRIENSEVLATLGLEPRDGLRYSADELRPHIVEFEKQVDLAKVVRKEDPGKLSVYQRKVLELDKQINVLMLLVKAFNVGQIEPGEEQLIEASFEELEAPFSVPASSTSTAAGDKPWEAYSLAFIKAVRAAHDEKAMNPATLALAKVFFTYRENKAGDFNKAVNAYRDLLVQDPPEGLNRAKADFEAYFNAFNPFIHALILYIVAALLAAMAWLGWSRPLNRASFWLVVLAFVVHTFALASRIYISGRPPVTNLYSSAVFIGWGCVVLGLVLEIVYRRGIGNLVAAVAGFATLLIAYFLAADGDTFHVLEAVLDTQFWLALHVTCVTLGYATTYFAGLLGVLYILRGVLTPSLSRDLGKELARMTYGVLCFALFFSFFGTVLGGLWADDSWGRFWGWDPKENGALIIVLWNALVLHARWGGMVKDRGLATLAAFGNVVVSWSWFGVNTLGVGLHTYGFKEGVMLALGLFVASQLAIVALGCLPKHLWWSSRSGESA